MLGDHVRQAGSLVTAGHLRFDFTHPAAVNQDDQDKVEKLVNEAIRRNYPVETIVMGREEATRSGATALFEERYGESVRVVAMGDYSKELCGGTHVQSTGQIGMFTISGESSVAAGVRRFECLTGEAALGQLQTGRRLLAELGAALKARPEELLERLGRLQSRVRELEKGGGRGQSQDSAKLAARAVAKGEAKILAAQVEAADPKELRAIGDELKDRLGPGALIGLAAATAEGKAILLVMVGPALAGKFKAGQIVAEMAARVGGKGGGRPDMAQAGGPEAGQIPAALEVITNLS